MHMTQMRCKIASQKLDMCQQKNLTKEIGLQKHKLVILQPHIVVVKTTKLVERPKLDLQGCYKDHHFAGEVNDL